MRSNRSQFTNRFGFIAAAAGSAVGLGNIWKFPFEVGNGGGAAFLLLYLIFCFGLAYPILVTEIAIGRRAHKSAALAFKPLGHGKWSYVGILGVICGMIILSFYNVVAGWVFGYFVEILTGNFDIGRNFSGYVKDIPTISGYTIAFSILTAVIVLQGVTKGIEKASKILMPLLLGIILFLVVYAFSLPNAIEGLRFYLIPNIHAINIEVIYRSLGQSFFSLSLGLGAMITYGSYLGRHENITSAAALITLADVSIAFLAGLMIFPFVFSQGLEPKGGSGLIFIAMPGIFETMGPILGIVIGSLFFLLLTFAALTSTISLLELPVAFLSDKFKMKRKPAVWISAFVIFLMGVPSMLANGYSEYFTNFITYFGKTESTDFMTFITDLASNTLLPLGGFLVSIFSVHIWTRRKLFRELSHGDPGFTRSFVAKYIGFSLQYIAPVILGTIVIITILETFFGINMFAK